MPRRTTQEINLKHFRPTAARGVSQSVGWVSLLGRRCLVSLVATAGAWNGCTCKREWTVTAYHAPRRGDGISAEASVKHGFRWEAAEMALQGLKLELEKAEPQATPALLGAGAKARESAPSYD
jgi:hypothetical protein